MDGLESAGETPVSEPVSQPTQTPTQTPTTENTFNIPDKFKEKGWAKNFEGKSLEDFMDSYDNAQSHIGRLTSERNKDVNKMSPEELQSYYEKVRPKEANEYSFPEEVTDSEKQLYGSLLHKYGLSKNQADGLLGEYFQTMKGARDEMYSKDGFTNEMKKSFGDGYEETAKAASTFMKKYLAPEDQSLIETVPNEHLGLIYRLTGALHKAYGVNEGDASMHAGKSATSVDVTAKLGEIRGKLDALQRRPHSMAEREALNSEYTKLMQKKVQQ